MAVQASTIATPIVQHKAHARPDTCASRMLPAVLACTTQVPTWRARPAPACSAAASHPGPGPGPASQPARPCPSASPPSLRLHARHLWAVGCPGSCRCATKSKTHEFDSWRLNICWISTAQTTPCVESASFRLVCYFTLQECSVVGLCTLPHYLSS
jgi:hypothetical protein